jgi:hypothetical protein
MHPPFVLVFVLLLLLVFEGEGSLLLAMARQTQLSWPQLSEHLNEEEQKAKFHKGAGKGLQDLEEKAHREKVQKEKVHMEKVQKEKAHREKVQNEEFQKVQNEKVQEEKAHKEEVQDEKVQHQKVQEEKAQEEVQCMGNSSASSAQGMCKERKKVAWDMGQIMGQMNEGMSELFKSSALDNDEQMNSVEMDLEKLYKKVQAPNGKEEEQTEGEAEEKSEELLFWEKSIEDAVKSRTPSYQRFLIALQHDEDLANEFKECSTTDQKKDFRMRWAHKSLQECQVRKQKVEKYKQIDTEKGIYRPFSMVVKKEGGGP